MMEELNLAGCCGLYCGLCPRFQSAASGRCPGCKTLCLTFSCKIYNCCVKKRGLITCAECDDFPCEKNNPETHQYEYFVTNKPCIPNLYRIREIGLELWLEEQRKRRLMLENLLANYNEGRSMSFYCLAAALMPLELIDKATNELNKRLVTSQVDSSDIKARAKALRGIIQSLAQESGIELKLRKKEG
jgi:hypothetical protein